MNTPIFKPADILLAKTDMTKFCVVACDQYTSEPEYWNEVRAFVGEEPSALNLVFPEADFKTADFDGRIASINDSMQKYLDADLFSALENSFIYVERTLRNGAVRHGLIGMLDLEAYDYAKGSQSRIRATEGTVLERIPPRVKIRKNAPLELPHVLLLIDDRDRTVIEPLTAKANTFTPVYDFDMMQNSGHLKGWKLDDGSVCAVMDALNALGEKDAFEARYGVADREVLQYAVGDGNHSLATAKQCYRELKEEIGEEAARNHPARYALVELGNLHDESLEFEAIHRVMFGIDPKHVKTAFASRFILADEASEVAQRIDIIKGDSTETVYITNPSRNLAVGSLQDFIDAYLAENSGEVDYIHGEDVVRALSKQNDALGFILEPMEKNDLFKTVILDGALPRKTFSMGEACDKRFYCEARKIR